MEKLYATYHQLEYRPPKDFETTPETLDNIAEGLGFTYQQFEDKSQSQTKQYRTTETFQRAIDLEFINSPRYGKTLNRVVIHGEAFEQLPLDVGMILTRFEQLGFVCTEAHSRILLPQTIVAWEVLAEHCLADAYTSACKMVSPITDPRNNYAKTWQFGKRPARRSAHTEGRRLVFYDAAKVHPEVPMGTVEMELQLFGDTGHKFIYADTCRDVDLTIRTLGTIRSFAEFKTVRGDSNRCRRPTADFWQKIIANVEAIHLPKLGKPEVKLGNRLQKFHQELFAKQQKLGKEIFATSLADYIKEHGLTDFVANALTTF